MAENEKTSSSSPSLKRSWFQELKGEFHKISWPNKADVKKQSITVIIASVVLGLLVAGIDFLLQIGLTYIVG